MAIVFTDHVHVQGTMSCTAASLPAACIRDQHWVAGADPLTADKQVHRVHAPYSQEVTAGAIDDSRVVHIARAAGTIRQFGAGCVTACVGAAVVEFDLLKNGVTVLSARVQATSARAAREVMLGTLSVTKYAAGDVFEITIAATAGGGTLGKGVFCEAVFDENPL